MIRMFEDFNSNPELQDLEDIFREIEDEGYTVTVGEDRKMSSDSEKVYIVNIFLSNYPSIGIGNMYGNESINKYLIDELKLAKNSIDKLAELYSILLNIFKRIDNSGLKVTSFHTQMNSNMPRISLMILSQNI